MGLEVQYPAGRWEVLLAVAALSDVTYQERVWIRHELPSEGYYDEFKANIHVLFDDWVVCPDPESRIGWILTDGPEIEFLRELGKVLSSLLDDIDSPDDAAYMQDPRWKAVTQLASQALAAMVLAGPIDISPSGR